MGESRYRGAQLFQWLYAKGAASVEAMTSLGKPFRERLKQVASIDGIELAARQRSGIDGTTKFLFRLRDGLKIEGVLIPPAMSFTGHDVTGEDEQQRLTLCVSTQVGCPLDCRFCATASMGFLRNLTAGEIIDQILKLKQLSGRKITNVVFMGMGEPLMNYDNVMKAIEILTDGVGIAARRVTLSTAGRADKIMRMADEQRRVKLAVSLHSAVDETRATLMPINKRFGISSLLSALEYYYSRVKQRVTYEYIFFDGINDTDREVAQLIKFARRVPCKINVIPFHSIAFTMPRGLSASLRPSARLIEIVDKLRAHHLTVMVRSSAGEDIDAACGQLAVTMDQGAEERNSVPSRTYRMPTPSTVQ
jgi:23S rRNA (adenine2503-C2)-methyltransferase